MSLACLSLAAELFPVALARLLSCRLEIYLGLAAGSAPSPTLFAFI